MSENKELNTGVYYIRFILMIIPIVNIIAALYWAMAGENEEVKSFGKAALLIILTLIVISIAGTIAAWNYILSIFAIPM